MNYTTGAELKKIAAMMPDDAIVRFHHEDFDLPGQYLEISRPSFAIRFNTCDVPGRDCVSIELTDGTDRVWEYEEVRLAYGNEIALPPSGMA